MRTVKTGFTIQTGPSSLGPKRTSLNMSGSGYGPVYLPCRKKPLPGFPIMSDTGRHAQFLKLASDLDHNYNYCIIIVSTQQKINNKVDGFFAYAKE